MSEFVKVRQDGSVNIPANLRNRCGILPKENFEISVNGKGVITLRPKRVHCTLCEAEVTAVDGISGMCIYCQRILNDMVRHGMDLSLAIKQLRRDRQHKNI